MMVCPGTYTRPCLAPPHVQKADSCAAVSGTAQEELVFMPNRTGVVDAALQAPSGPGDSSGRPAEKRLTAVFTVSPSAASPTVTCVPACEEQRVPGRQCGWMGTHVCHQSSGTATVDQPATRTEWSQQRGWLSSKGRQATRELLG